jgi:hypothetical protein
MRARPAQTSRPSIVALLLSAGLVAGGARADDEARLACIRGAERGQLLLRNHHLSAARSTLAECARDACPGLVKRDCTAWLEQAAAAMPSIVVSAKSVEGGDLLEGRVLVDGKPLEDGLDGRARDLEPGFHVVRLEPRLGEPVEESFVIREGEKGRRLTLRVRPPLVARRVRAPVPASTYVLGGTGLVALTTFGIFGTMGVVNFEQNGCGHGCSPDVGRSVSSSFVVADVSLGVAVVSLTVATILLVRRPWLEVASPPVPHAPE